MKLLDKIHLQKYIYIISLFNSKLIEVTIFVDLYLKIRREDTYWLSGMFDKNVGHILDALFLDISDYASDDFYNSKDNININEQELRKRSNTALNKLNELI